MAHKPMNTTPTQTVGAIGVDGRHRAGKRKRGTSVTKRKPRENVRALAMEVTDTETGRVLALNARTLVSQERILPDGHEAQPFAGTTQSRTIREVTLNRPTIRGASAVARFVALMDGWSREVATLERTIPQDAVFPQYAKEKPLTPNPWGMGE